VYKILFKFVQVEDFYYTMFMKLLFSGHSVVDPYRGLHSGYST